MHEAVFRIAPGGPYGEPTARTETTVELWCNDHSDLLSIRGDPTAVVDAVQARVGIRDRLERGDRTVVVTADCLRERGGTVEEPLRRHGCLLVPPLRYARGAKLCRILALDPSDLTGLYRDLLDERSVTVESKRSVDDPAVETPGPGAGASPPQLSARQHDALVVAFEGGYYDLPRGTTTAEIAAELGVERRTAEEHLRRAERKVMHAVVPELAP
ncbi:helix-turn-helix domain-containing protein [Halovivax limisalsi]|uniref:helix-turn-helix domain-containing protein n=1 Tax=Halovivax limisalsi TaxID=1453760 RepID=UPI001FFD4D6C|nr:helix-turn-helix domain-containing protein [Halovivax limisalsi]